MPDDAELLQRYLNGHSDEAFAELVARHIGLVYSVALRKLNGDVHRAKDVCQAVFIKLATHRPPPRDRVLTGWLYTTARNIACKAIRSEVRRRHWEQEAQSMQDITADNDTQPEWILVRPVLDDAMDELERRDKEALLLRYFERSAFADIGNALGVSENAARMRVDRAIEKLRALLARRGVTSTTAALSTVLAHQTAATVPAGLAASVTGAAVAATAAAGGSGTAFALLALHKPWLIGSAALVGVLVLNVGPQHLNARLRTELAALERTERDLLNERAAPRQSAAEPSEIGEPGKLDAERETPRKRTNSRGPGWSSGRLSSGGRSIVITPKTPRRDIIAVLSPEGLSSPMRAWQTMHRAGYPRERSWGLQEATICLDARAESKVREFLAALPETARANFRCPEGVVGPVFQEWLWRGDLPRQWSPSRDVPAPGDPTRATSYFKITYASGETREDDFPFKRFDDGRRYGPLTEDDAKQLLALLDPRTGLPKHSEP